MWLSRVRLCLPALAILASAAVVETANPNRLDPLLLQQQALLDGQSRIIVSAVGGASLDAVELLVHQLGGTVGRRLVLINGISATVPTSALALLASSPLIAHVAADRPVVATMERTAQATGAAGARQDYGLDGSGIGVAVIDSGIAPWHDDLTDPAVPGSQRVDRFVDFVDNSVTADDAFGHGTHVAGIIAGNGFDSNGARAGMAPAARLTVLKVLDAAGQGRISDVIAALDYVVAHKTESNIRIVNLSVGAGVYESFTMDPLTLAAKRTVDAGIVVVAAAGNLGRHNGAPQYGRITAPGNAPWVVTVGASSHMGTIDRSDDTAAAFSSRGPTAIDRSPKPDLLAPGVGIESLSAPNSTLYNTLAAYRLSGTVQTASMPYLSLTGTSMSAPVVSGAIALMLQANPALTPAAVKAILQYTARPYPGYDVLTQGTGFLNARGAIQLARYLAAPQITAYPPSAAWAKRLIWGTGRARVTQIVLTPPTFLHPAIIISRLDLILCLFECTADITAWRDWGPRCLDEGCYPLDPGPTSTPFQWPAVTATGVSPAMYHDGETVVWGTNDAGETVVWGTGDDGEMVVWGTGDDGEMVVWGTGDDSEMVVWGTGCDTDPSCQPVVWTDR